MTGGLFVQLLINGLMAGGIYALVSSGFTLILGVIKVFNFAQGQFYMLGAFITYGVVSILGLPYLLAILVALIAMVILGVIVHFAIIQWTLPSSFFHTMLVTVALGTIITQSALLSFGFKEQVIPAVVQGHATIGDITFSWGKLIVIAGAIVIMVTLYYFMKTKTGTAMLASSENREVASLQGINASRIFWVTMAVGCGLCGAAGALIAPVLSASSTMGTTIFNRSMLVVLVGGTGSMSGALVAAFLVGIVESFAYQYVGQLNLLVIFGFVAVLIFFRPGGLLGKPLPIPGQ
ncbi:MAG: branched-chain amino acid ABC transporter permease [Dehalococcoidales bacterium]